MRRARSSQVRNPLKSRCEIRSRTIDITQVVYRGGSCVVDPAGHYVPGAEPLWDTDGILYATLDMQLVAASKWEFDPIGHYARPDAVRLVVNDI